MTDCIYDMYNVFIESIKYMQYVGVQVKTRIDLNNTDHPLSPNGNG